jgi:hypothetical protein
MTHAKASSVGDGLRAVRLWAVLIALLVGVVAPMTLPGAARADDGQGPPVAAVVSRENAERQAALVAAEDRRLTEIRTVASLGRWQGKNWKTPYRLSSGSGYTLVLTASSVPYTLEDLQKLAPQTLLRMSDGSFLLTENIVVAARATLHLSAPGGLTLRLASGSNGFATLVSFGGTVELEGEQGAPLTITSWDANRAAPDLRTVDGRAYVRAIGGQFEAKYVRFSHLGFWSGRTGGLSLTGQDRPNTGAIESLGQTRKADDGVPSLLDDVAKQPAGPLQEGQAPTLKYTVPELDYVSTRIADTTIDGDAFGLFVSGANGVQIDRSTIKNSSIAGVVLHRYVTNGAISKTVSEHNVGDGITLDRATTGITINESTARSNSGSGFSLSGRALADGPSAAGSPLTNYGNSSISNSVATGNGHYGIEVTGGFKMGLQNNRIMGNDMGIVVTGPASDVSITGNTVRNTQRHGIALLDGVTASTVTGNVVDGAGTGVYLRGSSAEVRGNTVQRARSHGVSLVGSVSGTQIEYNVLAGSGPSALDIGRSNGHVVRTGNQVGGWHDTSPWYFLFKKLLHPMTALWTLIALLVVTSAVRGRGRPREIEHPYAHQQIVLRQHLQLPVPASVVDMRGYDDTAEGRHARENAGLATE